MMENMVLQKVWQQGQRLEVDDLRGCAFTGEDNAHTFEISGKNAAGAVSISGTIAGKFLRSDNVTVPVTGTASEGVASITLTEDCYVVPGRFIFSVYANDGTHNICIYCGVGNVLRTDSGEYEGGEIITDVTALMNAIETAVATIPADYSTLLAAIAPTFSASTAYTAGSYVWYDGTLYRFTADHAAGSWTGSDAVSVSLAGDLGAQVIDLKSALELDNANAPGIWELGNIGLSSGSNTSADSNTRMRTIGFLGDSIASISKLSGNYILYAYEGDTYIGHWNGTGFDTTTRVATLTDVDLSAIKSTYPTYKYRLVWYLSSSYTPVPSTDYANIILYNALYNEFNNMREQIDDVADDINEVIENQDRINNENYIGNLSNADLWESGQIGTSSGNNGTSASRMRTKGYISDYTYQISTSSGYFILFAYDPTAETPYQGVWTGNAFEKIATAGYSSLTSFVLANIKSTYPNYKYRLVWYLSSSYTPVPATDYANILIANEKTAIAYGVTLNGAKIVNMGDSIFGLHFAPVDISTFISQATGATCYNCAFPGTRAVTRSENIGKKKFDLTTLVDAIISGDFSAQDAVREAATGSTDYDHLPTLESVDFSTVDVITLSYGTNDYGGDVVIGTAGNGDASTFIGAMQEAIGKLETAFPKARIFVCTPIYRSWHNESSYENADTRQNANSNTLLDFVNAVKTVGQAEYIDCIDNHWIGINAKTRTTYTTDGTHPNEAGRRLIARNMANKLY